MTKRRCKECKKVEEVKIVIVGGKAKVGEIGTCKALGYICVNCAKTRNTENDEIITYKTK